MMIRIIKLVLFFFMVCSRAMYHGVRNGQLLSTITEEHGPLSDNLNNDDMITDNNNKVYSGITKDFKRIGIDNLRVQQPVQSQAVKRFDDGFDLPRIRTVRMQRTSSDSHSVNSATESDQSQTDNYFGRSSVRGESPQSVVSRPVSSATKSKPIPIKSQEVYSTEILSRRKLFWLRQNIETGKVTADLDGERFAKLYNNAKAYLHVTIKEWDSTFILDQMVDFQEIQAEIYTYEVFQIEKIQLMIHLSGGYVSAFSSAFKHCPAPGNWYIFNSLIRDCFHQVDVLYPQNTILKIDDKGLQNIRQSQ